MVGFGIYFRGLLELPMDWMWGRFWEEDGGRLGEEHCFRGGNQMVCLGLDKFEMPRGSWIFTFRVEEERSGLEMDT